MSKSIYKNLILVIVLLFICNPGLGSVVYNMEITDGLLKTSGGFNGNGFGTFGLNGTFSLEVSGDGITFINSNVIASNVSLTFPFSMPQYPGTINGVNISGQEVFNPNFTPNKFQGIFDGSILSLQGIYSEPIYDGFLYDYNINAVVVPLPDTLVLFSIGLMILRFKRFI